MKRIFLTGFMGAGKTTVGAELSKKLNLPAVDTDHLIEESAGKPIKEIFKEEGEAAFRLLETKTLKEVPLENIIVTTGGGLVISPENRRYMLETGAVVYLECHIDTLYERLLNDTDRPLIQEKTKEDIHDIYKGRMAFYEECTIKVDTSNKTLSEITEEIAERLK